MRAKLASLIECAVPFFKLRHSQLVLLQVYNLPFRIAEVKHMGPCNYLHVAVTSIGDHKNNCLANQSRA